MILSTILVLGPLVCLQSAGLGNEIADTATVVMSLLSSRLPFLISVFPRIHVSVGLMSTVETGGSALFVVGRRHTISLISLQ